ncbi:probable amino acid permease 7 isoform X2 [Tanacetum coccineum]
MTMTRRYELVKTAFSMLFTTSETGSGVLSLAWSTAQLGWIGGPIALVSFAIVTYVSSFLLSDCYRSPDPVTGTRNRSFTSAVRVILGRRDEAKFSREFTYETVKGGKEWKRKS